MTTPSSLDNPLPAIRRVVTTHDSNGEAKVWINELVRKTGTPGNEPGVSFGLPWTTDSAPADCQTVSAEVKKRARVGGRARG